MKGLYTVVVTPFTKNYQLDKENLRQHLRFQLEHGVDGIVVLGTTGEAPTLSHAEKEAVIRIAVEEVKGRAHLMVGTGSYSTQQTIEDTLKAQDLGADAALVVTPYYNKPTQEGLYLHFKALAEATTLPICVYNIQGRTGVNVQTDTLARIATLSNILGVKEASGNVSQMSDVIETIARHRSGFNVLSGDDGLTLPLLALGGHGIFSVVSNLVPGPVKKMVDLSLAGHFEEARNLHYALAPLFKNAFIETNPSPIKAALQMCGRSAGPCRLPLCDLRPENNAKLQKIVEQLPAEWLQRAMCERVGFFTAETQR